MTIVIKVPPNRSLERAYILGEIIGSRLGLPWVSIQDDRSDISIRVRDQEGEIVLPDVLFQSSDGDWLEEPSMPEEPLRVWDTSDLGLNAAIVDHMLPVIFGDNIASGRSAGNKLKLPVDIFGSAFFMLTRYEEIVRGHRDQHDRFSSKASLAYRNDILERPIIDEYVEVLWGAIQRLWPGLTRTSTSFEVATSHDVDRPSRYGFRSIKPFVRAVGADIIRYRTFRTVLTASRIRLNTRTRLHDDDPYNTFDWLMDVSESVGLNSAFYFICGRTDAAKDADYDIGHPAMRQLIRKIHSRGHEVGLHPSYNSYLSPSTIVQEATRLRALCDEERIHQLDWGGRMHYLRWKHPTTMYGWEEAGMTYDSTLGFADHPGFRCGTCHEYKAFDPIRRKELALRLRPLIAMDRSVLSPEYLGLSSKDEARVFLLRLKDRCRIVKGQFTLLWHNSVLGSRSLKSMYVDIVSS